MELAKVAEVVGDLLRILSSVEAPIKKLYLVRRRLDDAEAELSRRDLVQRKPK